MKTVGLAELKRNLSRYLRVVEAGGEIEVTDRGRSIARLVPIAVSSDSKIRFGRRPFAAIRDRVYPPVSLPIDSVELLVEERGVR
jgi:prevent-host-death family protein